MPQSSASYEVTVRSAAPPEAVFAVLDDARGWPSWAGFMIQRADWERAGTPSPGGVGAIRRMGRWPQFTREEILEHDAPNHVAYTVVSGFPVRDYRADIDLAPGPDGDGTVISWRGSFREAIPHTGQILASVLDRVVRSFATRAAREAERRVSGH